MELQVSFLLTLGRGKVSFEMQRLFSPSSRSLSFFSFLITVNQLHFAFAIMALYDDPIWLLSHINHSFVLSDETGNSELVLNSRDAKQLRKAAKEKVLAGTGKQSLEPLDLTTNLQGNARHGGESPPPCRHSRSLPSPVVLHSAYNWRIVRQTAVRRYWDHCHRTH